MGLMLRICLLTVHAKLRRNAGCCVGNAGVSLCCSCSSNAPWSSVPRAAVKGGREAARPLATITFT